MATVSLTDPVAATTVTAGLHAGNNAALRTAINGGLDNTNITAGAAIDLAKLAAVAWTAYSPTWTSAGTAPAILNGTVTGRYVQIGKAVWFRVLITAGTTTTFGSANTWTVSLPVTAHANATPSGTILAFRAATQYLGQLATNGTTTVAMVFSGAGGLASAYASTTPAAWASGDTFGIAGFFEAA